MSHILHQVPKLKKKHKMFFENKEKLDRINLQNNADNYKWVPRKQVWGCCREMEHAEVT